MKRNKGNVVNAPAGREIKLTIKGIRVSIYREPRGKLRLVAPRSVKIDA